MPNATCPQALAESPAYQADQTADLHHMMTETPAARYTPEILGDGLDIVFCGLNPAPSAVAGGHNFSHPNNRFWSVLHLAGFTDRRLRPEDERRLLDYRCGITAVVARAMRRAADVSSAGLRTARPALEATIRRYTPTMVAFLGKRGATAMLGRPQVQWGAYEGRLRRHPRLGATKPGGPEQNLHPSCTGTCVRPTASSPGTRQPGTPSARPAGTGVTSRCRQSDRIVEEDTS
jgi:TDG/mug DNA glycosylase family protein